jgi:hypothetical protein
MCKSVKPRQIGEREEIVEGQRVKVKIFESRPAAVDAEPIQARDDSDMPWQRMFRGTRQVAW